MKIAVTTASGLLGSSIIKHLIPESGAENVIGIARSPEKIRHLNIEVKKGDYNSKADFEDALIGVDAVLLVSGNDPPDKRILQHRNVIEAAKINGIKKIVYTSIFGAEKGNAFSPIVASNRQTEKDIQDSGLMWAIGRNGIYVEPDLEYIENYKKEGAITNCAAEGKCGYTSRNELALAYSELLLKDRLAGKTYNLFGTPITQERLTTAINNHFNTNLKYVNIEPNEYMRQRKGELGSFLGTIIAGIYTGIKTGAFDGKSHFEKVTGRPHKTIDQMIEDFMADAPR